MMPAAQVLSLWNEANRFREALIKSAGAGRERFCLQARYGKWRNTVCTRRGVFRSRMPANAGIRLRYISHFSYRRLGVKDPPSGRRRLIQRFLRKTAAIQSDRCHSLFIFLSLKSGVSQVRRRAIREYFRGIGFLHRLRFVSTVYHTPLAIGEEILNVRRIFYAGYTLLMSNRIGSARVNTLTAQAYMALRDRNIMARQPPVRAKGPTTAT